MKTKLQTLIRNMFLSLTNFLSKLTPRLIEAKAIQAMRGRGIGATVALKTGTDAELDAIMPQNLRAQLPKHQFLDDPGPSH